MEILNQGFDHVEFVVNSVHTFGPLFQKMGFEKIGERELAANGTASVLYAQGLIRILITQPTGPESASRSEAARFLQDHAEGICVLGLEVADATKAFTEAVKRGARPAR